MDVSRETAQPQGLTGGAIMPVNTQYPQRLGGEPRILQSWGIKCAHLQTLLHCMKEGEIRVLCCIQYCASTNKHEGQYDIALLHATLEIILRTDLLGVNGQYKARKTLEVSVCVVESTARRCRVIVGTKGSKTSPCQPRSFFASSSWRP